MELDKRIKEGKRPLTCLDIEQAREFVGKECIFSDKYENFKNLDKYLFVDNSDYSAILSIDDYTRNEDYVFRNAKNGAHYGLILPLEWVEPKEEKYRAYTLEEFLEAMESGLFESWITMRPVGSKKECQFLYTGYQETEAGEYICLGCFQFDFISLFKNYEIQDLDGEWHPFGILDEERE